MKGYCLTAFERDDGAVCLVDYKNNKTVILPDDMDKKDEVEKEKLFYKKACFIVFGDVR